MTVKGNYAYNSKDEPVHNTVWCSDLVSELYAPQ
ncbi:Uncharacterised protein [Mycobacteroides abscessus subsp. abscessus]|nr:Uncharacterised protein [Mycobacteroides abscessus subsp. abscessus]SIK13047.1 Uncharacterised protein [Mycobacteroides abscessus subsp. abscessus]SIN26066.1 Uncharacterised protein [Mycobacteroides abscessus subsp. abscessus]SLI50886.1 Uncharacterised protein [Mycobacteroides abscessus subsp. abscessus]